MEQIPVIILPDGVTAREINRMGEKPDITESYPDCTKSLCAEVSKGAMCHGVCWRKELAEIEWQNAESSLRTFEIESCEYCGGDNVYIDGDNNRLECPLHLTFEPGTTHTAEVLSTGKIRIVQ